MATKYDVYHFDPRGAWRLHEECESLASAKQVVKRNKLTRWKILKVDTVVVSESPGEVGAQSFSKLTISL